MNSTGRRRLDLAVQRITDEREREREILCVMSVVASRMCLYLRCPTACCMPLPLALSRAQVFILFLFRLLP